MTTEAAVLWRHSNGREFVGSPTNPFVAEGLVAKHKRAAYSTTDPKAVAVMTVIAASGGRRRDC